MNKERNNSNRYTLKLPTKIVVLCGIFSGKKINGGRPPFLANIGALVQRKRSSTCHIRYFEMPL